MSDISENAIVLLTILMCCGSIFFDIKERRIPNWITLPSILIALMLHLIQGGIETFTASFIGMLIGGGVFFYSICLEEWVPAMLN